MATFRDRLSHLSFLKAAKILGPRGQKLINAGGKYDIDLAGQVELKRDVFRLLLPEAQVSIIADDSAVHKMRTICSVCEGRPCEHAGAAFSTILEEKTALGLAAPPAEDEQGSALSEEELVTRELARRRDRAGKERMTVRSLDTSTPWSDYTVYSRESGKTYRVALRGLERGESYCSCPDFRKNTLGTCKHVMRVISVVRRRFAAAALKKTWKPDRLAVYVRYGANAELRMHAPENLDKRTLRVFKPFLGKPVVNISKLVKAIAAQAATGVDVTVYPDAEDLIAAHLHAERITTLTSAMRANPANHPQRTSLLKVELMPYQLEGIAFAVEAGRSVLADDMGLGKTIQAIGAAQLLARECNARRVLVVCPASVKSQWREEIRRFSDHDARIVGGTARERREQYAGDTFFTLCNYEQVLRDLAYIEKTRWDLIVLDEGQRIKNWESKTSRTIKGLRSRYALVLSGTPLENRLEELYSVIEFIDDRRLGPDFRFHHEHRIVDDRGRTTGYGNLDSLRAKIAPVLLRRTRREILKQLPPRTNQIIRIAPTEEQMEIHVAQMRVVSMIARKAYISEMDLLRLQKALLMARMSANSTFLVDRKHPSYSTKVEQLAELLPRIAAQEGKKAIVFSEWTTMLDIIEKDILKATGLDYVRLDGSVPQGKRGILVRQFNTDPACRFFLATNAGATGLNLQAANTIVNVDLPWNPAVLEQRIGRAHRMGQKNPVHVYLMVTENTIEENMLGTLSAKQGLATAALDPSSDVTSVDMASGMDELKKRLEVLLGEKPEAEADESRREQVQEETERLARKQRVENAGGDLLAAAFSMLSAMMPRTQGNGAAQEAATELKAGLEQCLDRNEDGSISLKLRLPNQDALDKMCEAVAGVVAAGR